MSTRSLNGLSSITINTFTAGNAIKFTSGSTSQNQTIDLSISKQSANTTINSTDLFVLEDSSGNIRKITGANMKSELEQSTVVEPLLLTGNAISIKGLSGFTANKILKVNSSGDAIEYANDNNTEYTAGTNLLLSVGNEFSLNSTISNNIIFNGTPTINNFIEVKGQSGQIGYINFYDIGTTNNISLIPPTNISGGSYNITLPGSVGTIALTTGDITGNASTATKILSITNSNIVQLTTTQTLTNKTITGNFTGGLTGNADTSTKIASITNSNIVQLTESQVLSNKTFNDLTIFNNGLAVKQSASNTSGNVRFFDDNNSHFIDLHIQNETVASDLNLFLPNDINNSVLVGTINTQTLTNKTLSSTTNTITQYTGNSSAVITTPSATGTLLTNQDTIPVNKGGTNITTYTVGDILYASATGTLSKLAKGSTNTFLMSNGTIPFYGTGFSFQNPLSTNGIDIGLEGISGFGNNNQILATNGSSALQYRTLTAGENISIAHTTSTITISSSENYWQRNSNASSFDLKTTSTVDSIALEVPFVSSSSINISGGLISGSGDYLKWVNYKTSYRALESFCVVPSAPAAQGTTHFLLKNGQTDFISIQQNTIGSLFINFETSGIRFEVSKNWEFGHDHAKFKFDTSNNLTFLFDPQGTNGAATFAGSYLAYDNNGSAIYLNTPAAGTSAGDYIGFATGNVPKGRMSMDGNFKITGSVTESHSFCDERVKENIQDYNTNATELLNKLKIKSFNRKTFDNLKSDENGILLPFAERFSDKTYPDIGLIAQDVLKIPELEFLVENQDSGDIEPMTIPDWNPLTAICIKSIQELNLIIQQQQVVINNLLNSSSFKEFKSK